MRHERDKTAILSSMMGYATHKKVSPEQYFKDVKKIKSSNEILELNKRQAKLVKDEEPENVWTLSDEE